MLKKGSKTEDISYPEFTMDAFLQPNDQKMSLEELKICFSLKYKMLKVKANFPKRFSQNDFCVGNCEEIETDSHILNCKKLSENSKEEKMSIQSIYSDICSPEQKKIAQKIIKIMDRRETRIMKK